MNYDNGNSTSIYSKNIDAIQREKFATLVLNFDDNDIVGIHGWSK